MNIKPTKIPINQNLDIDYNKVKMYWNNVSPSILGPYKMEGFGFPIGAGYLRYIEETKLLKKLTTSIKSSTGVLDLGSGTGNWTRYFANHFREVISVEMSNILYEKAQTSFSKMSNIETIHSDILSYKTNKKFGLIFLGGVLMYLNQTDVEKLLLKASSWLEPEGIIICRESTIRKDVLVKQNEYQVIYRSINHYKSIFDNCNLFIRTIELNSAYVIAQMSCEVVKKWKNIIPERYWNLPIIGSISYWIFKLGYPQNIKIWTNILKKIGIKFPKLLNHFFVLKPFEGGK